MSVWSRTIGLGVVLVAGIGGAVWSQPSSGEIRRAFDSGDRDRVVGVLREAQADLDKGAVRTILGEATSLRTLGVYEELVECLQAARGDALEEVIKRSDRERSADLRFLLVDVLAGIDDAGAEEALLERIEEDRDERVAVLAVRRLARRSTNSTVDGLIGLLEEWEEDDDRERLVREIKGALSAITGETLTVAQDWRNWWEARKDSFEGSGLETGEATSERGNVLDRLRRERPADLETMTRLRDDEVIVIRGRSDRVEEVLEALELAHQRVDRDDFLQVDLDPSRQVLILNCAGNDTFNEQEIQKVREFVANGGYLFSSDWELRNTLQAAFPEVVTFLRESPRDDVQITIQPHPQTAQHPLMRDVFPLSTWAEREFSWQLDGRSHLVRENPALIPLVISRDMESMGSTTVAFTFGFTGRGGGTGRVPTGAHPEIGRVLHVLSHFENQRDASGDGFALQQILLNFIVEKQEQRKIR